MSNQKKIALILSGCGFKDGSEINEAVLTMLAIEEQTCSYQCYAPDIDQHHVVNHITDEEMKETRNVLIESARIARGNIKNLNDLRSNDYDAVVVVGGFGVAKNLSNFAFDSENFKVNELVINKISDFKDNKLPCGFICIAPILIGKIFTDNHVKATIGNDESTSSFLKKQGVNHLQCAVNGAIVDDFNKVVSTPAFMLANNISEARSGISILVEKVIEFMDQDS